MEIDVVSAPPGEVEADVLAFSVSEPAQLVGAAKELDDVLGGQLSQLIADGELKGALGSLTLLHTRGELAAHRVAAAGLGKPAQIDADALRTAAAKAAGRAASIGATSMAWLLAAGDSPLSPAAEAAAVVEGAAIGPHNPGRWKTSSGDNESKPLERLILCGGDAEAVAAEARRANVVSTWTNRCRDLVNAPGNELTPAALAAFAEETAGRFQTLRFEALGPDEIRAAGMGAFAAVAQGSHNPPRLISILYEPPDAARPDVLLGLVGKGITFDSGGLSLKPAGRMDEMKSDMGGAAAVLAAAGAIAELGLGVRVLTVVASCENMPGGHSYRPGDIVTAANGKTIEITNTDAEGRLVLADALWYARESGATHVVDLATLTGGIVVAIGDFFAGLFGNDADWSAELIAAAEASGDHVWLMPLHETYARYNESTFADLKNSSDLRQAQPAYAARFLQEFAGEGPWAHLDIAGTAFLERGRGDYYSGKGATGYGVRLLTELARRLS